MTILDAIHDTKLFGPLFTKLDTWNPWLTFLKAIYGLPMDATDLARFQQHTGRHVPRSGGYPEAACIVGCQSGKSQIASLVGSYEAMQALKGRQRGVFVPLLAQDLRSSQRALFGYVREAIRVSPMLSQEVVRETSDIVEFSNGVTLAVYPCRPAAIRGIRAACVIIDELAFFISTEGRPTDTEMLRAARTRTATTGGKILILSSPYAAAGALWDLHRKHFGQENSPILIWQASAPEMNPTLPIDYLERMAQDDPEAYRSEVLGQFRQGVSTLFDPEALDACVQVGVRELAPDYKYNYLSGTDVASGSGKDAFAVAVAHADGERLVLDALRTWRPPFNPSGVIAEAATFLRSYRISETTGDRYAPGFVNEGFAAHHIHYQPSNYDRSATYLELLPLVNSQRAVLLDHPELLRELRGLERRRGTSGKDRVDHRPGQHEDTANAAALAIVGTAEQDRHKAFAVNFLTGQVLDEHELWRRGLLP